MMTSRVLGLGALCCAAVAEAAPLRESGNSLAFASSFTPALVQHRPAAALSPFVGELSRGTATLDEVAEGVQGLSMASRRNLKKEKRARNEQCARQYRKPKARFSRGGGNRADRAKAETADSEWLEQIYGQHTIYKRDLQGAPAATEVTQEQSEAAKKEREAILT